MDDGTLPNLARLAQEGTFQPLPTTNPAQSPVAWSSFATGLNPGEHGIYDFVARDPHNYGPLYSVAKVEPPKHMLTLFGYQVPLDAGLVSNKRVGTPFWYSVEREGQPASVLRVPVTYPPDSITRMLSGMGVPDLLGTQGTFTLYTTEQVSGSTTDGRQVHVNASGGRFEARFEGPPDPFLAEPTPLSAPILVEQVDGGRVRVTLDGTAVELGAHEWSSWVPVKFVFGGFMNVRGIVRLHLAESFPDLRLYISPIQIDPRAPAVPISSPADYAADLANRIGLFHTIGMPEETWSLNDGKIDDDAWLDMEAGILKEREAMFFDTLERQDSGLVVQVFVQTDRTSHMFWRGLDPQHPLHNRTSERGRNAIKWIYQEADRIVGRTRAAMRPGDWLIILSDHGFAPFRRSVHINRWLVENGFMTTKPNQPTSSQLFSNVNWTRTQAYAIGLNGIYLNLKDREGLGIVRREEAEAVKREIIEKLRTVTDPATGAPMVVRVYDGAAIYAGHKVGDAPDLVVGYATGYRASWQTALGGVPAALVEDNDKPWSGDHCIDPPQVPGVLFTSFPLAQSLASIADTGKLIRSTLQPAGGESPVGTAASVGWLDLPAPALSAIDRDALGWLSGPARVVVWSLIAALTSMLLYRVIARPRTLARLNQEALAMREKLNLLESEGRQQDMGRLFRRSLGIAGRQLGIRLIVVAIASLPILFILVWMSNAYDASTPIAGETVRVTLEPVLGRELPPVSWRGDGKATEIAPGAWNVTWPGEGSRVDLYDSDGLRLLSLPSEEPVRTVAQRAWHNVLLGNPGGYLPSPGDVEAVSIDLPRPAVMPVGPDWVRGWLPVSLVLIVAISLLLRLRWRLH
jgi:predicted AlkP superfamily phosphohydrolase/phosphomutase